MRNRPDGRVDGEGVRHTGPRRQGQIDLENTPLEHGQGQRARGQDVADEQDGSGRAAAEAVERRTRAAVTLADQVEQGIFQEETSGENRQAGGFRRDQDVCVLEQGREIRGSIGFLPGKAMVEEGVAPGQQVVRKGRKAVEQDLASFDPPPPFLLSRVRIAVGIEGRHRDAFVSRSHAVWIDAAAVFHQALEAYSPVRVSTRMTSPAAMYSGTWTTRPVESVAGFVLAVTDPPFMDGRGSTISTLMKVGISRPRTRPSDEIAMSA